MKSIPLIFAISIYLIGFLIGCSNNEIANERQSTDYSRWGGRLEIEPRIHQLGQLTGGLDKVYKAETVLKNNGTEMLQITDILVSCDCTTIEIGNKSLSPGQTTKLKATIKIGDSQELRSTRLLIKSTDKIKPNQSLIFEWQPVPPIFSDKASYQFYDLPPKTNFQFEIPIRSKSVGLCNHCKVEVETEQDFYSSEWQAISSKINYEKQHDATLDTVKDLGRLKVVLFPRDGNMQYYRMVQLNLTCQGVIRERLNLPVRWSFDSSMLIIPQRLFLGQLTAGETVKKEILLKAKNNRKFEIKSVSIQPHTMNIITENQAEADDERLISVSFQAGSKTGPWLGSLTIETNLEKDGVFEIPVSCIIR